MTECRSYRMYFTIKWVLDRSYLYLKRSLREATGKKKKKCLSTRDAAGNHNGIQAWSEGRMVGRKMAQQRIALGEYS